MKTTTLHLRITAGILPFLVWSCGSNAPLPNLKPGQQTGVALPACDAKTGASCENSDDATASKDGEDENNNNATPAGSNTTSLALVDWKNDISPLLSDNCISCHTLGDVKPYMNTFEGALAASTTGASEFLTGHRGKEWSADEKNLFKKWKSGGHLHQRETPETPASTTPTPSPSTTPTPSPSTTPTPSPSTTPTPSTQPAGAALVTWDVDIGPMFSNKGCNRCHSTGDEIPYLDTYSSTKSAGMANKKKYRNGHRKKNWNTAEKKLLTDWRNDSYPKKVQ